MKKILIVLGTCVLAYYAYNAESVYGQYLFNQLCDKEGGPRFYKKVEKGQGWVAEGVYSERAMKRMNLSASGLIGFFRFKDESGRELDTRLKSIPPYGTPREVIDSPAYTVIEPANLAVPVRYAQKYVTEKFNPDPRFLKLQSFSKSQTQYIDLRSNEVVAIFTSFGYTWTKPERVILSAPTAITCHIGTPEEKNFGIDIFEKGELK